MSSRIGILRPAKGLDARYAEALAAAGAAPLPIDVGGSLDEVAGLLIPGGGDFLPPHPYPPAVRFERVPDAQLASDERLLGEALARGLPVLGICYGMQLIAKTCGGSFLYDLATDLPGAKAHRLPEPDGRHAIEVARGSRLAACLAAGALDVNSSHHQAVASPGDGLCVVARAGDGVIEALESDDARRFVLGVQWHPERMPEAHRRALFAAFVDATRGPRRG